MIEFWLPVVGWEDLYEVSNLGAIRRNGKKLKPFVDKRYGYVIVSLFRSGKGKTCRLHRVVALSHIGPQPTERHEINHLDGNKENNQATNLEWVTRGQNHKHAYQIGLRKPSSLPGSSNPHSKLTESDVLKIREMKSDGIPGVDIARAFNIAPQTVSDIHKRRRWKHL